MAKPTALIDWDLWASGEVQLRDAVALSCGIDPEDLVVYQGQTGGFGSDGEPMITAPGDSREFDQRLATAQRHAARGAVSATVRLREFGVWAEARGWKLPAGFPWPLPPGPVSPAPIAAVAAPAKQAASVGKPLGTRERTNLLVIIGALAQNAGIDIGKRTVAAKKIRRMVREVGCDVPARTIENYLKSIDDALDRRAIDKEE